MSRPRSPQAWQHHLSQSDPGGAVIAAGLCGDKQALLGLVSMFDSESVDKHTAKWFRVGGSICMVRTTGCDQYFMANDLQTAVAIALSFDDSALPQEVPHQNHVDSRNWAASSASPIWRQNPWGTLDEELLGATIRLYMSDALYPPGRYKPLEGAESGERARAMARLMSLTARYARNEEAVQCFQRCGVPMNTFANWVVEPEIPGRVSFNPAWIREQTDRIPLPFYMLRLRDVASAAALMDSMDSPSARNIAQQIQTGMSHHVFEGFQPTSVVGAFQKLGESVQSEAQFDAQQPADLVRFMDVLEKKSPSAQSKAAQMEVLRLYSDCLLEAGIDPSNFISGMLQVGKSSAEKTWQERCSSGLIFPNSKLTTSQILTKRCSVPTVTKRLGV